MQHTLFEEVDDTLKYLTMSLPKLPVHSGKLEFFPGDAVICVNHHVALARAVGMRGVVTNTTPHTSHTYSRRKYISNNIVTVDFGMFHGAPLVDTCWTGDLAHASDMHYAEGDLVVWYNNHLCPSNVGYVSVVEIVHCTRDEKAIGGYDLVVCRVGKKATHRVRSFNVFPVASLCHRNFPAVIESLKDQSNILLPDEFLPMELLAC